MSHSSGLYTAAYALARRVFLLRLVTTLAVYALASCESLDSVQPPLNVLLVTLDTTRADAIGPYGGRGVTPTLDQLGQTGVVFEQASTVAPLTLPAHSSLVTGLFPPRHHVHENGEVALASRFLTLAERLKTRGVATGAFVGSFVSITDGDSTKASMSIVSQTSVRAPSIASRWPPRRQRRG